MNAALPPRNSSQKIAIVAIISLTLLSGVAHGYLDGRWAAKTDLQAVGQRLSELPEQCGDWVLLEQQELDPGAATLLRCYGSEVRVYQHQETEVVVNVALLFGPRGPIAVHTPEICYSSSGTKQFGETQAHTLDTAGSPHTLWQARFTQDQQPEPTLDVWYAWSDGGPMQAAQYPRVWLTENLYKIQVAGPVGNQAFQPCRNFLTAFLPYVEGVVE
ncbi:exosortase-associated EpsI family protein [Roseimaritima ulvae]|uniref:Methanolan biosynthesis EpsI domain-containing protein n=1 Tax=Roseimaritima ulvae TaxID=980254 RepID=A0A5B9R729_9BACT|nr:exosortase-associated EpsI family protein [Roseimaritima ulvae]QEG42471.1 hypothetical protein UC8_45100 [Roseimaritima ulvae]